METGGITGPPADAQPNETKFSSFTPSPRYMSDHTIFAVGTDEACTGQCTVLFRSTDAGHSWQQLPGLGLAGTQILLPPSYPNDATIFASGNHTLARSGDGGRTFQTVFATPHTTAYDVDPTSPAGGTRILIGETPLLVYDDAKGRTTVWDALPPTAGVGAIVRGPGTSELYLSVGGETSGNQMQLYQCVVDVSCTFVGSTDATALPPWAAATFDRDHTLFLYGQNALRELDVASGQITMIPWGSAMGNPWTVIPAADFLQSRRVDAVAGPYPSQLWESVNGSPFRETMARSAFQEISLDTVKTLPDGHLLAAWNSAPGQPGGGPAWGLGCSADDGYTWGVNTCP